MPGEVPIPNHRAIVDDSIIEWIAEMDQEKALALYEELDAAERHGEPDVVHLLHKFIRAEAAAHGRHEKVFDIARNQEAIQVASEAFAPRRGV